MSAPVPAARPGEAMTRKRFLGLLAAGGAAVAMGRAAPAAAAGPGAGGAITSRALAAGRPQGATMFAEVPAEASGIRTTNDYAPPATGAGGYHDPTVFADRVHVFDVGAVGTGVAVGDYDGDGRPDLFVVSKTESCRLFRNLGGWKFEDVTERAGVGDRGEAARIWKQGATFVDIDNNGLLDLYVCRFGAPNLLYVNQGDGTFKEEAAQRGLAVNDASVMAAFCDYDRDGHLDVFVQTNLLDAAAHPYGQRDYLFHNNGDGTFTDVTDRAGIAGEAQGHSAVWWDYDGDGWPDLYVANDFAQPDKLYRNNRDGTFTDVIDAVVPHMPFSSMGSDLGDVNNDGRIDLLVGDMAATTHQKDQRTMAALRRQARDQPDGSPAAPQYSRNALYLNTGVGRVLEGAELAGVAATDWTWAVRLEDLDNDGRIDLLVTNGMHHEVTNVDLIRRVALAATPDEKVRIEQESPVLAERHLALRNVGDLRFEDATAAWGLERRGVSFGAAFGDFGGTGNLDLVYANYRQGVSVFRNDCDRGHRVLIEFRGRRSNRFGVGTTVRIETAAGPQVRTLTLARGILSSSEPVVHFGLGAAAVIARMRVEWPSGHVQEFTDLPADRRYTVTEPPGAAAPAEPAAPAPGLFEEAGEALGFTVASRENPIDELEQQPLLPMRCNRRGPAIAVGDLDGGGRDHVVIGGTVADPLRILRAGTAGRLAEPETVAALPAGPLNDGPVLLFDAAGNGAGDLLVTRGGVALPSGNQAYVVRLLLNDGRGGFRPAGAGALPDLRISAGVAIAGDFDRDGRLDLFIGGRVDPGRYPHPPPSALLANRGGRFEDVTLQLAPALRDLGMVTSALWTDVDGDGWLDLLVTLEWGGVRYFHNDQGRGFSDWSERAGFAAAGTGWWTSLAAGDFNGDGRPDYVVGNVGLNTPYQASPQHPALLFAGEFNPAAEGSQLVEAYYEGDRLYPWRARQDLGAEVPSVLRRFPRNDAYARATLEEILGAEALAAAQRWAATELRSGAFIRNGTHFEFRPLPRLAQIAPIQGLVVGDFEGDGVAGICAVQNSYAPVPSVGRFDGGLGLYLRGDGDGGFEPVPPAASGLVVPGDAKALAVADVDDDGRPELLVSRNNGSTLAFRVRNPAPGRFLRVRLRGPAGNPQGVGALVTVHYRDGRILASEVYAGGGYLSQASAACFFGYREAAPPVRISVRWPDGRTSDQGVSAGDLRITIPPV